MEAERQSVPAEGGRRDLMATLLGQKRHKSQIRSSTPEKKTKQEEQMSYSKCEYTNIAQDRNQM